MVCVISDKISKIPTIKEFAKTYLDMRLQKAEIGDHKYKEIYLKALAQLPQFIKSSKKIAKSLDVVLSILIIPATIIVIKKFTNDVYLLIISVVLLESIKFFLSTKTQLLYNLMKQLFFYKVKKSAFFKVAGEDIVFWEAASDKLKLEDKNIWKK